MDRETATPEVGDLPGPNAREHVAYHQERAAPSTYVYDFVWDHDAPAIGPFCTDVDGNVLMDWTGQVGAMPLGYDNPKILEPLSEFDLPDPTKIAGQDFYAAHGPDIDEGLPGPAALMERLTEITDHYGMDTVFLSNTGAEAMENALKIAYNHTRGKYAVTFEGAFHGRTLGVLSLNRSKAVHREAFPEIPSVHDVPFCRDRDCDPGTCGCGFFGVGRSRLRRLLDPETGQVNPEEVAAVVLEPVQGEGGYQIPSDAFMGEVASVCSELDVPIVVDEVQTGLGRTGEWWGADHFAIEPDVVASAKSLRVGATVSREEVFPDREARLSSTWGAGDVLAAAQGALTIDAIREHDLRDNATAMGDRFLAGAREALDDVDAVTDVRGLGLLLAVEFDAKATRDDVQDAAFRSGFLTLGCGHRTLRLLPPLDSTEREIDLGLELLSDAVEEVA